MDVEIGQLTPFAIEEFRDPKYGFCEPNSSWCMQHCKDYDVNECACRSGVICLGRENWRSLRAVWDNVNFVPTLMSICQQMCMPKEELQHLFTQISGKYQDEACALIRKEVSWDRLAGFAQSTPSAPQTRAPLLRSDEEMIAIRAMCGSLAPMGDHTMKGIIAAIFHLRESSMSSSYSSSPLIKDAVVTPGGIHLDLHLLEEELGQAFQCSWSSRIWDAARKESKSGYAPTLVVECPKSGAVRSAMMTNWEGYAEAEGKDTHLFHPWFSADTVFVIDWEVCPVASPEDALGSREVLAFVMDEATGNLSLCIASLEQDQLKGFVNWVCLETLAYLGDDHMWHKG